MTLALRLALRELRGGWRGLRVALACLALGVASIAAVQSLRAGIAEGIAADGRRILGGDLEVQSGSQPLPDPLRVFLRGRGATLSDTVTLRAMLVAGSGERLLVELKAVDAAWPLVGVAQADPPDAPRDGLLLERLVLDRLRVAPGAMLRLGEATLPVRGVLLAEPDRVAEPTILGPRALVSLATLDRAALLQPGSIAEHRLRATFPPDTLIGPEMAAVRTAFPDTGWRIRDAAEGAPGVSQFVNQASQFLTLVGLSALLVGGVGVAGGVRAWLLARARSIATLRCLGASARLILLVNALQLAAIGAAGILAGLVGGTMLSWLATRFAGSLLPASPRGWLHLAPLALAASFGVLTAACFAAAPLTRAMRIPGAALFRDVLVPGEVRLGVTALAVNAALALLLAGLAVLSAYNRGFALWFCGGSIASIALFRAGASLLMRAAKLARTDRVWLRLGLANLYRPGSATPLLLVSVGLGLSALAAVTLIDGNLRAQVAERMPADAPRFFFIDIQPTQLDRFRTLLGARPGVRDIITAASLRARIVAVKGVPVDKVVVSKDTEWALRGDRGLSLADAEPPGTRLTAGAWWPPGTQAQLASFDANLARGWGVGVGDTLRVNVLGRDVDLTIANLRDVAWRTIGLNFTLIASPGLLSHAPYTTIATVRSDPADDAALLRTVTDALPNVSGIRVADVLDAVADLLGKVGAAVAASGSLTLVAGALVLAGSVAAGQQRRIQEAVTLKVLGASRAQIRAAWLVEFGAIGLAAGLLAALAGTLASWAVMRFVMQAPWSPLPGRLAITIVACVVLMLGFGYLGTARALRARAAPLLRNA